MDFYLKDGTLISVRKIADDFSISPEDLQYTFNAYLYSNLVVAGTYCPDEPDWIVVRHVVENMMFGRQVEKTVVVDAIFEELENDPSVIY